MGTGFRKAKIRRKIYLGFIAAAGFELTIGTLGFLKLNGSFADPLAAETLPIAGLTLGGALVTLGLGWLVARSFTKSLQRLGAVTAQLAAADESAGVPGKARRDLGELTETFAKMAEELRQQTESNGRLSQNVLTVGTLAKQMAQGDLDIDLAEGPDAVNTAPTELMGGLTQMQQTLREFMAELQEMARQHAAGDIGVFMPEERFEGAFRTMAASVNAMVKEHITVKKKAMACVAEFANGNFDTELEQFPGKKAFINEHIEQLRQSLTQFIDEMHHMATEHDAGDIEVFMPEEQFQGAYREMAQGVNEMVKGHITVKKKAMACVAEFANGNFDTELEQFPGKKAFINDNIELLRHNVTQLINEMKYMSDQHDAGDIDVFVPEEQFQGAYRVMAQGVNEMVKGHITVKKKAMACVAEFAKGNFDAELEQFPGKKAFINDHIEGLRQNLQEVNGEIQKLIAAAQAGRLQERAAAQRFTGDWAKLIQGLNGILDGITEPIREAATVLAEVSRGNLSCRVAGDYQGDHAQIKDALNDTIDNLNEVISEIRQATEQVALGSNHVANSSQALSQGSTEQASSLEEITSSIAEIASQTKQNALNADRANNLSTSAKESALNGDERMQQLAKAMDEIKEASHSISKIIKVIDEIAFQTNILALNAAVEAARAGQHGKGFAVVAEEVRNLASRSAGAAKETAAMIEGSIDKVQTGTAITAETVTALHAIVETVSAVASLVGEIAIASNQQASGITQINTGLEQVSQVTLTNTATAEESAATSEELSSQAEFLKGMVERFQLNDQTGLDARSIAALPNGINAPAVTHQSPAAFETKKRLFQGNDFGKY